MRFYIGIIDNTMHLSHLQTKACSLWPYFAKSLSVGNKYTFMSIVWALDEDRFLEISLIPKKCHVVILSVEYFIKRKKYSVRIRVNSSFISRCQIFIYWPFKVTQGHVWCDTWKIMNFYTSVKNKSQLYLVYFYGIKHLKWVTLSLTSQGHSRSYLICYLGCPNVTLYQCLM